LSDESAKSVQHNKTLLPAELPRCPVSLYENPATGWTCCSLFIRHWLVDIWVVVTLGCYAQSCYEHLCEIICVDV
jgi:1,2-phenylacetyl-CoA epoxidase catalytic subunit